MHSKRSGNVIAFIAGIAHVAENVMERDMEEALQLQQKFVAFMS